MKRYLTAICLAAAATAVFAGTAGAFTAAGPTRWYSPGCPTLDYWGNRIVMNPIKIDMQPGVGQTTVDGSGIYRPTTQQFVYYRLWAYSYKFGTWYTSPWKRVLDGFPGVSPVQAYDATHGRWAYVDVGIDNADLAVGPNAVSLRPPTGSGTWAYGVETYWAPPFVNETVNDITNPSPASGGLYDTYDSATQTCTF
jgi:hypothetical protein